MKKVIPFVKKHLPDGLIFFGVLILSYNLIRPVKYVCSGLCNRFNDYDGYINYRINYKMFGVFLLALGIIIMIRHYFISKNKDGK